MSTLNPFVTKFASSIVAIRGCHHGVIFKSYLPFGGDGHLNRFVDYVLKMGRKDFLPFVQQQSDAVVGHAKALGAQAAPPYPSPCKDTAPRSNSSRACFGNDPSAKGWWRSCVASTVKLFYGQGRPRLVFTRRPQRALYY